MPTCAVARCCNYSRNTKGSNLKYFRFPKIEELSKQWVTLCRRMDKINLKNATICSIHFEENCFEVPLKYKLLNLIPNKNFRLLKPDALPTLHLPKITQDRANKIQSINFRTENRRQKQEVSKLLLNTVDIESTSEEKKIITQACVTVVQPTKEKGETEILKDKNKEITETQLKENMVLLEQENAVLLKENKSLQYALQEVTQLKENMVLLEQENAVLSKENKKLQETVNALNCSLLKICTDAK